jgi:type III secretion protein T
MLTMVDSYNAIIGTLLAVMPRVMCVFLFLPLFSNTVPSYVIRAGLGLSISIFVAPAAYGWSGVLQLKGMILATYVLKEASIGALLGLGLGVAWHAAAAAGALVDNVAGTSNGNVLDPITHQEQTVYSSFFGVLTTAVLLTAGFIPICVSAIIWSYAAFTPTGWAVPVNLLSVSAWMGTSILNLAVFIAAPFIVILSLVELLFGLLNRFVPQLNSQSFSLVIRPLLASLILIVGLASFAQYVTIKFNENWDQYKALITK